MEYMSTRRVMGILEARVRHSAFRFTAARLGHTPEEDWCEA
jgi:hypothetical protein